MSEILALTLSKETNFYWNLLKDVNSEVKLHLITLLSQSMTQEGRVEREMSDKERTKVFLDEFYGAWRGEESADEIMANIRSNSSIRTPTGREHGVGH